MVSADYIHSDPGILSGRPVVRGTRLSVEFLLGLFAAGLTEAQILESYPHWTPDAVRTVFSFAAECIREMSSHPIALADGADPPPAFDS